MRRVVVYPDRIAVEAADIPAPGRTRPWSARSWPGCADPTCTRPAAAIRSSRCRTGRATRLSGSRDRGLRGGGGAGASGSSWNPTCPAGRARCAPPDARTCARTCSSSAAATLRAAWPDYFTVAANRLHPVPDVLDDHAAALIEPLSTPVHAVRLAGGRGRPVRRRTRRRHHRLAHPRGAPRARSGHGRQHRSRTWPSASGRRPSAPTRPSTRARPTSPGRCGTRWAGAPTSSLTACPSSRRWIMRSPSPTRAGRSWWWASRPGMSPSRCRSCRNHPDPHPGQCHLPPPGLRPNRLTCCAGEPSGRRIRHRRPAAAQVAEASSWPRRVST